MENVLWYQGNVPGHEDVLFSDGKRIDDSVLESEAFSLLTDDTVWNKKTIIGKRRKQTTAAYKLFRSGNKVLVHTGAREKSGQFCTSVMFCQNDYKSPNAFCAALKKAADNAGLIITESDMKMIPFDLLKRWALTVFCVLMIALLVFLTISYE